MKTNRRCYTALEIEGFKADIEPVFEMQVVIDSDVLRASLAIFLILVDGIIIFKKYYGLKAEIELQESRRNCLIKSFFLNQ